ncbi:MAG TPA: hypothetical protein VMP11_12945 [Verrucomicrobiae bacterium]|nr:hypothetical protein [Verrucomicrobiae bacterium]
MKIRADFVTNSSSTSFLIVCKGKPTLKEFFAAVGIQKRSPLAALFEELYEVILEKAEPLGAVRDWPRFAEVGSLFEFVKKEFSENTAKRAESAMRNGEDVWYGRLASEGGAAERFFCCESFEVERADFYMNALPCAW